MAYISSLFCLDIRLNWEQHLNQKGATIDGIINKISNLKKSKLEC